MSDEMFVNISVDMLYAIHTQLNYYAWGLYNDHCLSHICEQSRDEFLDDNHPDLRNMLYEIRDMIDSADVAGE